MPRYKPVHKGLKLLPVDFDKQVRPGSFEHALCYLVDRELDLTPFHARYRNGDEGASAYDPAVLLKIILLAYSRGIVSSRKIEAVGREMFAIDGVKLPSNAAKAKSGTRKDFQRQAEKMEQAARKMLDCHRDADAAPQGERDEAREARKLERLQQEARQMRAWLAANPEDRKGSRGSVRLSNRTDNESAKMATSKGVIQGYTGAAVVDEAAQVIVEAQAHGTGSEQELLVPLVEATEKLRTTKTVITADAGYHSEAGLKRLAEAKIDAYLPDNGYRKRDERYQGQEAHKAKPDPLYDKRPREEKQALFKPEDFQFDPENKTCVCPAGKALYGNGSNCVFNGYLAVKFQGAQQDCLPCALRSQCLRTPYKTKTR